MKLFFAFLSFFTVVSTSVASAQTTISRSAINFKIKNLGISTSGTIGGMQASIHFNPADLNNSTIEATVETSTLNTENSGRDEHIKNEDFFDVTRYPKITMKSLVIKHKGGNKYVGTFSLTIKAKTKQVEIPFTYTEKGNIAVFNGSFTINRLDYGVGSESMILANEVNITIDAEVNK